MMRKSFKEKEKERSKGVLYVYISDFTSSWCINEISKSTFLVENAIADVDLWYQNFGNHHKWLSGESFPVATNFVVNCGDADFGFNPSFTHALELGHFDKICVAQQKTDNLRGKLDELKGKFEETHNPHYLLEVKRLLNLIKSVLNNFKKSLTRIINKRLIKLLKLDLNYQIFHRRIIRILFKTITSSGNDDDNNLITLLGGNRYYLIV